MLALGSALAMLMVGFGVDVVAGDRTDAPAESDPQDTPKAQTATKADDASYDAAVEAPAENPSDGLLDDPPEPERNATKASAEPKSEAEMDALVAEIDAFLSEDAGGDDTVQTGIEAPAVADGAPAADPASDNAQDADFLAFLDGPDGLFDNDEATPEATDPIEEDDPTDGEDDIASAFLNDDLFGEHSIEDLFSDDVPELDIEDYSPGEERLVLGYDDDGSDPALGVDMEDWDGLRVASVTVDGEIVARIGLAEGARDMTSGDIALVAES